MPYSLLEGHSKMEDVSRKRKRTNRKRKVFKDKKLKKLLFHESKEEAELSRSKDKKRKKVLKDSKSENKKLKSEEIQREAGDVSVFKKKKKKKKIEKRVAFEAVERVVDFPKLNKLSKLVESAVAEKKETAKSIEIELIQPGDTINITDLLFTPGRDFLIKNNGDVVKVHDLADKVVVLFCIRLCHPDQGDCRSTINDAIEAYNQLRSKGGFEIVLIAKEDDCDDWPNDTVWTRGGPAEHFKELLSLVPWPAIPFSDLEARKCVFKRFVGPNWDGPRIFFLDPGGKVIEFSKLSDDVITLYGAEGFPFSRERIAEVENHDKAAIEEPSLEVLLSTEDRDFVISSDGTKVPICDLKQKVVGLFFYQHGCSNVLLEKLKGIYGDLKSRGLDFEIVLIDLYYSFPIWYEESEETFKRSLGRMPWLAVPFMDPCIRRLHRIFDFPDVTDARDAKTFLPIIGPDGSFLETYGAHILEKYGSDAYPFTRQRVLQIEMEKLNELTLDAILDQTVAIKRPNGIQIRGAELSGKKVLLFFGDGSKHFEESDFVRMLLAEYTLKRDTDEAFEVVYIQLWRKDRPSSLPKVPWLVIPYRFDMSYKIPVHIFYKWYFASAIVAFGSDGRFLAKESRVDWKQRWDHTFPFISCDLKAQIFNDIDNAYEVDLSF